MAYYSTKTYDHNEGLSCAFRQWRAKDSHCKWIHGYAIAVTLKFGCKELDDRNWVQDFGGLKDIKAWLKKNFDHTLCIAEDDPEIETFKGLEELDLVDLNVMPAVGCEKFAEYIYNYVSKIVDDDRKWLESVEVREHGANSAIYSRT
jgi:6-pyruvoyltetrahydropterin/6-carboxytetrahydropterin synthase|tara:strand:- start:134 stop:574 length:441 start_codon:yes stop_codon:yes gene_type:complete